MSDFEIKPNVPIVKRKTVFLDEEIFDVTGKSKLNYKQITPSVYVSKYIPKVRYYVENGNINAKIKQIDIAVISGDEITMEGSVEPYSQHFEDEIVMYLTMTDETVEFIEGEVFDWLLLDNTKISVTTEGYVVIYCDNVLFLTDDGISYTKTSLSKYEIGELLNIEVKEVSDIYVDDCGGNSISFETETGEKIELGLVCEMNLLKEGAFSITIV